MSRRRTVAIKHLLGHVRSGAAAIRDYDVAESELEVASRAVLFGCRALDDLRRCDWDIPDTVGYAETEAAVTSAICVTIARRPSVYSDALGDPLLYPLATDNLTHALALLRG